MTPGTAEAILWRLLTGDVILNNQLSTIGFLRLKDILGDCKTGTPAIIPVSKSTWWHGIRSGRFPKPIKLGERITAWRVEDIRALIEQGRVA